MLKHPSPKKHGSQHSGYEPGFGSQQSEPGASIYQLCLPGQVAEPLHLSFLACTKEIMAASDPQGCLRMGRVEMQHAQCLAQSKSSTVITISLVTLTLIMIPGM